MIDWTKMELLETPTQEEIKYYFSYNPDSGVLYWKNKPSPKARVKIGNKAGTQHPDGYIRVTLKNVTYPAHHLVWIYMKGYKPDIIDHKNHIRNDNTWDNLQESSHLNNNKSALQRSDNTSGVTGVSWNKRDKVWVAYINDKGAIKRLGSSKDKDKAIELRRIGLITYKYSKTHGNRLEKI